MQKDFFPGKYSGRNSTQINSDGQNRLGPSSVCNEPHNVVNFLGNEKLWLFLSFKVTT